MKKLCLVFSACTALAFSGTVNAQSMGDIIQSPNGDYKAYEVVDGTNLFEGTIDCSFENLASKGEIKGWYGGDSWVQAIEGSNAMYASAQEYKEGVRSLQITADKTASPTSLRTSFKITESGLYLFRGWTKTPTIDVSKNRQYNILGISTVEKTLGNAVYQLNVASGDAWSQSFYAFNVEATVETPKYLTIKFAFTNKAYVDAFSLIKVKETPNLTLLEETMGNVSDLLMDADQYEEELVQRLVNWVEYADAEIDRTDCDAVSGAIAAINNITKDLDSYNDKIKSVKEEIARASELGVDEAVWYAYLVDPFYNIDGLYHDLIVEEFNVVKNLYAEEEDTELDFRSSNTNPEDNTWLNEIWFNDNLSGNNDSPIGYEVKTDYWNGVAGIPVYNLWSAKYGEAYSKLFRTITLPAGEYVLKVSGRSLKADVVASIDGKQVSFPKLGSLTGYGIDINGDANYSADGEYANSDKGHAWEWRFIPLTLDSEREVEIFVSIDLNGTNNKGSIADVILLRKNFNEHKRSVTSGDYGTISLPYEVDMEHVSGVDKVYSVSSMTSELATLTPVEAMEAGKPYIFKANKNEIVMPAKVGGTVVGTPQEDTYLVGTFSDIDKLTYNTYVISGQKFYLVNSDVKCPAYRCYFKELKDRPMSFGFVEDGGETTGIDKIERDVDMKNAVIYDLTGRRVTSPVKGIYIVNGKKMVVDNLK